jgi:DNA integrity scanning protein DisA with diadenylate cyclase activity
MEIIIITSIIIVFNLIIIINLINDYKKFCENDVKIYYIDKDTEIDITENVYKAAAEGALNEYKEIISKLGYSNNYFIETPPVSPSNYRVQRASINAVLKYLDLEKSK